MRGSLFSLTQIPYSEGFLNLIPVFSVCRSFYLIPYISEGLLPIDFFDLSAKSESEYHNSDNCHDQGEEKGNDSCYK